MIRSYFEDDEIPYEVLNRFGLSQEMIEDLPQNVLSGIRDGRRSPVLPICYTCEDGFKVHDRARFSLLRDEEGARHPRTLQSCRAGHAPRGQSHHWHEDHRGRT